MVAGTLLAKRAQTEHRLSQYPGYDIYGDATPHHPLFNRLVYVAPFCMLCVVMMVNGLQPTRR